MVPPVAVALLVVVTVVLATAVGTAALDTAATEPGPQVVLSLAVQDDRIALTHRGGATLDVRDLRVRVSVDGTDLDHQPPVPFFSAAGFRPGPTGPFNSASDPRWSAGETASVRVAGTNDPALAPGARVSVRIYDDDVLVATLSTTVPGG